MRLLDEGDEREVEDEDESEHSVDVPELVVGVGVSGRGVIACTTRWHPTPRNIAIVVIR